MTAEAADDSWARLRSSSFPFFALLYLALFAAFGSESPFFPSFLAGRGLTPGDIGTVLAAATVVRLSTGPVLGVVADRFGTRLVLALAALGSGAIIFLYLGATGFWVLLAISMSHAVVIAPLNPLADALCVAAGSKDNAFSYGWVRGIGSGGFIVGTMASGVLVAAYGLDSIIIAAAVLFILMAVPVPWLPASAAAADNARVYTGIRELIAIPTFQRVLLVAALVIGSHAMSDTFAVIHWRAEGVSSTAVGLLWSEAVASEIVVFALVGPYALRRFGPGRCAVLAALAGVVRWTILSITDNVAALAATQLLHGLTFAMLHLACMQVIRSVVPDALSATAQTLYGTLSLGIASAILTWWSGKLYGVVGAHGFLFMAALCALALPLAAGLDGRTQASRNIQPM